VRGSRGQLVYQTAHFTVHAEAGTQKWGDAPTETCVRFWIAGPTGGDMVQGFAKPRPGGGWRLYVEKLSILDAAAKAIELCNNLERRHGELIALEQEAIGVAVALGEVARLTGEDVTARALGDEV
jgi:hypothetical protein